MYLKRMYTAHRLTYAFLHLGTLQHEKSITTVLTHLKMS